MSAAVPVARFGDAQRRRLDAVAVVLVARFGDASEAVIRVQAAQLVATEATAADFVTKRADDAKAIRNLVSALEGADAAMTSLSKPTRDALFHRLYMKHVWQSFGAMAGIAGDVGSKIGETPFSDRENVRAIFIVDDARGIWARHKGKEAPAAALNDTTPFAEFLADLFQALGVGASPRSAFQAWRKYRETGVF
jgi:hypothetical protein